MQRKKSFIRVAENGNSLYKTCLHTAEFEKELFVYQLNLPVTPRLISILPDKLTLELERIYGETLSFEKDYDFSHFAYLFSTLHEHTLKGQLVLCHIDTNPQNYIIREQDNRYLMLDFSESEYSVPENDLINFLLFFAHGYEPDRFNKAVGDFLKSYGLTELLDEKRKADFDLWFGIFDERRRRFNKAQPRLNDGQETNRNFLRQNFYTIIK